MFKKITKSSRTDTEWRGGNHRFEHWYADNQVYFMTARCRDRFPAFATDDAKAVFWDRFVHYTGRAGFVPMVTTLLDNHYHTLGYLKVGENLKGMMQGLHGSVSKLVNDILQRGGPAEAGLAEILVNGRLVPFFRDQRGKEYFDGCIRNEQQCRLAYRYTLIQSQRHGLCADYRLYPHTRVNVELERAIKRALQLGAFLPTVGYRRYERR
jgi:hypothetical protein